MQPVVTAQAPIIHLSMCGNKSEYTHVRVCVYIQL